jgi:hypothetical protein
LSVRPLLRLDYSKGVSAERLPDLFGSNLKMENGFDGDCTA